MAEEETKKKAKKKKAVPLLTSKTEIDRYLKSINNQYNNPIVTGRERYELYSSGISGWDRFYGGIPKGTGTEIYGIEESGKTTLALTFCGAIQKQDSEKRILYIDFEDVIDMDYAKNICDMSGDQFILLQPESLEEGWNVCLDLIKKVPISAVVIDSIAAMVPQAELDGDVGKSHMGLLQRLIGQALRKTLHIAKLKKIPLIFTNQVRTKIGVMFGDPDFAPGGNAVRFRMAIRAKLTKSKQAPSGFKYADTVTCKTIKNKVTGKKTKLQWLIAPDEGILTKHELLTTALEYDVIQKVEGSKVKGKNGYYYKNKHIGATASSICDNVLSSEKNAQRIYQDIMEL